MSNKTIWVKSKNKDIREDLIGTIIGLSRNYSGTIPVKIYIEGEKLISSLSMFPHLNLKCIPTLKQRYGEENVRVSSCDT